MGVVIGFVRDRFHAVAAPRSWRLLVPVLLVVVGCGDSGDPPARGVDGTSEAIKAPVRAALRGAFTASDSDVRCVASITARYRKEQYDSLAECRRLSRQPVPLVIRSVRVREGRAIARVKVGAITGRLRLTRTEDGWRVDHAERDFNRSALRLGIRLGIRREHLGRQFETCVDRGVKALPFAQLDRMVADSALGARVVRGIARSCAGRE